MTDMVGAVEDVAAPPPTAGHDTEDLSPAAITRGKRTKRYRPHSPVHFTISPPPVTAEDCNTDELFLRLSPTSSGESTTSEEVDTARCLILLSKGLLSTNVVPQNSVDDQIPPQRKRYGAAGGGVGVYTCKTCNRVFSSFQALGGHRTSHRKPKNERRSAIFSDDDDFPSPSMSSSKNRLSSNSLSLQLGSVAAATFSVSTPKSSSSPRIHECSYCGAEFTSGQALGGHMRKHRTGPIGRSSNVPQDSSIEELKLEASKRTRYGLSLDLNFPAPEDENQRFGLRSRQEKDKAATGLSLSNIFPPTFFKC